MQVRMNDWRINAQQPLAGPSLCIDNMHWKLPGQPVAKQQPIHWE